MVKVFPLVPRENGSRSPLPNTGVLLPPLADDAELTVVGGLAGVAVLAPAWLLPPKLLLTLGFVLLPADLS